MSDSARASSSADRSTCVFTPGPLCTPPGGLALGALCVMDTAPREFTREDEGTLADLAALVVDELELRRLTARLRTEVDGCRRAQRTVTRQHRLLRRLSESQEDRIHLRTNELLRTNEALRAEITRRERTDAALQQAKEEAERANNAKSDFLSRMSHELRTPLNAILGFGRILQGPLAEAAQRDCANHVVTAGRHLLSLINEVLDIARIEAGHVDLSLESIRASEVVDEALDLIRPLAAERGILVKLSRTDGGCGPVLADRQRFKQVLLNLFSNAVKYSPAGSRVTVRCRAERAGTLRLSVADQGPGFTRERAGRVFVAFDRLGAERSGVQGTGLGLTLSKRLIEAMGGDIGVRTAPGRGSTFWVRLPLARTEVSVVRETTAASPYVISGPTRTACTLLYIEDHPSNVHLIEHLLVPCPQVKLLCARRGEEGLAMARRHRPDLILLDLHLPDLPGWEVLAKLRSSKTTKTIPVVAISADATADTVEKAMQAGAQSYLTMPVDVDGFFRILPEGCRTPVPAQEAEPVSRN